MSVYKRNASKRVVTEYENCEESLLSSKKDPRSPTEIVLDLTCPLKTDLKTINAHPGTQLFEHGLSKDNHSSNSQMTGVSLSAYVNNMSGSTPRSKKKKLEEKEKKRQGEFNAL